MSKTKESVQLVSKPNGYRLQRNTADNGEVWWYGIVVTPLGYVHVHMEPGFTSLSAMVDSHEVNRFIRGKSFSRRGIVTVARRFIQEIQ